MSRRRKPFRLAAALVAAFACALVSAPHALAGTAEVWNDKLTYTAGAGETNTLSIEYVGVPGGTPFYRITDTTASPAAGGGCTKPAEHVLCEAVGFTIVELLLGDGNDVVSTVTDVPDPLVERGGDGDDTLTGGDAIDTFNAGSGDDVIQTNDDVAETGIECGSGTDRVFDDVSDHPADDCEIYTPRLRVAPSITGEIKEGVTLEVTNGQWEGTPTPDDYAYEWLRCDGAGANCASVENGALFWYVAVSADVGGTLRAVVTAKNESGATSATSDPTATVISAPPPPPPSPPAPPSPPPAPPPVPTVVRTPKPTATPKAKQKPKKVTLCHKGRTIKVPKSAVKKHRRHGDKLGKCKPKPKKKAKRRK
ncbi:MAG: hypothetical protein M3P42_04300 [Actinomycetota bacterium]|nr:hypothetical protein [Actinomycetota bacterium]